MAAKTKVCSFAIKFHEKIYTAHCQIKMNFYNTPNYTSAICTQSCNGKTKVQRRTKIGEKESSKNNTFYDLYIHLHLHISRIHQRLALIITILSLWKFHLLWNIDINLFSISNIFKCSSTKSVARLIYDLWWRGKNSNTTDIASFIASCGDFLIRWHYPNP